MSKVTMIGCDVHEATLALKMAVSQAESVRKTFATGDVESMIAWLKGVCSSTRGEGRVGARGSRRPVPASRSSPTPTYPTYRLHLVSSPIPMPTTYCHSRSALLRKTSSTCASVKPRPSAATFRVRSASWPTSENCTSA